MMNPMIVAYAAAVLEEERQQRKTQRGAHPLDRHDDRESPKRLLRGARATVQR